MIIETDRLILREFIKDDLDAFAAIMADPEVMRFSIHGPHSRSQVEELINKIIIGHYSKFGFGLYAIIHKEDQQLIGYAGLTAQRIDGEEKIELGYRLNPKYWGKGLATEASLAICRHAFDQLNINELISIIDPQNIRSIAVAKRVGMVYWKESVFHQIPVHIYVMRKGISS